VEAVFSTPANEPAVARKAIERRTDGMQSLLERYVVTRAELAARLDVPVAALAELIEQPRAASAVMIDGEDAVAADAASASRHALAASDVLTGAAWPEMTLRFWRPAAAGGEDLVPPSGSLDAVVLPKVSRPDEVRAAGKALAAVEARRGMSPNAIRVCLLVETARALAGLMPLVDAAGERLCAVMFGSADYAADLGLTAGTGEAQMAWAAGTIVNAAAAAGVPAIAPMTVDFPVGRPGETAAASRGHVLSALERVHRDALRAAESGMAGKLVGHPAQLFAVLLAFGRAGTPDVLEGLAADVEAYQVALADGRGVLARDGRMIDRATDRAARSVLRRAVANGRFDAGRAVHLGIVAAEDLLPKG
jgi:citrate lyase beta subunit